MKLILSEEVLSFAASKGEKALTVDLFTAGNSCIPVSEPHVHFGPPKDPVHKYDVLEQDGLKIYIFKGADAKKGEIRIHVKRFLGMKSLEAEGLNML
ncbi:CC/Se motif family (seleno)protein [Acidaminobacter hydrogenoformans]|uniref:Fe-S cluster assembly iron-binding protein IscA n=1 Tax=Acidaminobacter hydrogenoformans DSM 2784 TaxID=1120920 RepID=A0A1G5RY15_9FIRM|nr:CC/Se motif family (seleno)protein [Acidaminobacter hydrogenoformans]SCZ78219.1 hypothetical protein SAMN03080599_01162 [Acidaminobacter hydrogenoformans DSM 2784]